VVPRHVMIPMSNYDATPVFKDPVVPKRWPVHEIGDGPHFEPSPRYSRCHVLLYSVPISQCTPLHSRTRKLSALIQSGSGAGIIRSRHAAAAMNRFAWCNRKVTPPSVCGF
jgi:hypothetical protein